MNKASKKWIIVTGTGVAVITAAVAGVFAASAQGGEDSAQTTETQCISIDTATAQGLIGIQTRHYSHRHDAVAVPTPSGKYLIAVEGTNIHSDKEQTFQFISDTASPKDGPGGYVSSYNPNGVMAANSSTWLWTGGLTTKAPKAALDQASIDLATEAMADCGVQWVAD